MRRKFALLTALLLLGMVSSSFVEAQAVVLNVSTRWLSNNVLTSRLLTVGTLATFPNEAGTSAYEPMISDDEVIYVDAELNITTNTQFWAVQVDCTATNTMLETYTFDPATATDNPGDNSAVFTPNTVVTGLIGQDTTVFVSPFGADKGKFSVTLSRLSDVTASGLPFGVRGITNTYLMGTIRLRVRPQILGIVNNPTFKGSPTLVCTPAFVDRNGASVGTATYTAPKPLTIIGGYSINGTAKYQGQTTHSGITVYCDNAVDPNPDNDIQTDAMGNWKISGFRTAGDYSCWAHGNRVNPSYQHEPDAFLAITQYAIVTNQDIQLLPVKLPTGDVNRTGYTTPPATFVIDSVDLAAVTGNYNTTVAGPAFRLGDANGDTKVDKSDLALVTGNYGLTTQWQYGNGLLGDHIVLSGQTTPSAILADNRILVNDGMATINQVATTQLITGTNRDFWATVSPSGKQIAFSRSVGTGAAQRYQVFVAPIVSGVVGVPVRVSTGTLYDESAPSWSPDGLQVAYTCSPVTPSRDIQSNSGSLCLNKNPGGVASAPMILDTLVKIYPATWRNNNEVFYGGATGNDVCTSTLCKYLIATNEVYPVQSTIFGQTGFAGTLANIEDMPVIRGNLLYYRYDDGNAQTYNNIYVTTLDIPAFGTIDSNDTCEAASFHVSTNFLGNTDYYTLQDNSYNLLIMPYSASNPTTLQGLGYFEKRRDPLFCADPNDTDSPVYLGTGSLNIISLNTNLTYTLASPSDVYATRISLQWLP